MVERIRSHDWATTSLGSLSSWPQTLRTAVGVMLGAPVPMHVYWGAERVKLYNDAAVPHEREHPRTLGTCARDRAPGGWDAALESVFDGIFRGAPAIQTRHGARPSEAGGAREGAGCDHSISPIPLEDGSVGGVLVLSVEASRQQVQDALAQGIERDALRAGLTGILRATIDPHEVPAAACRLLGEHLGVQRVVYLQIEGDEFVVLGSHVNGVAPLPERGALALFGDAYIERYRRGKVVVAARVADDARLNESEIVNYQVLETAALVGVGLRNDGAWLAALVVHGAAPRAWSDAEVALIEEVADRIWSDAERVRAEEAARESEARFSVLVEAATQSVWETDAHGVLAQASASERSVPGQNVEDPLSKDCLSAVHPDDRAYAHWKWRVATAAGRNVNAEFRVRSADGGWRWTNVRAGPLRNREGRITKWVGMNLDITARKKAELAVRENESRRTFLLELSDQIRALADPHEVMDAAAERLTRVLGLPFSLRSLPVPQAKDEWLRAVMATAHPARRWTEGEKWLLREVAERTWAAVERARAEQALRRSEQRLKQALAIETVGVLFFDLEGRILDANPAFERMSGYDRYELQNAVQWQALTPPEFREITARAVRNLAAHGETPAYEKQLLHKDGSRSWGLFAAKRLDGSGDDAECVEFVVDISAHKRVQQQREDLLAAATTAQADAERANTAKDEFLATLSHELRTPLAAILLWAAALKSGAVPPEELEHALDAIVQSAESQSRLVEDLLDLSRLASGKVALSPIGTAVEAVAQAAIDVVRPLAQAKAITLEVDIPGDLGMPVLDAARFKQVLWNLLSNATKFTEEGGRVGLRLRREGGCLQAEVSDTGVGIAPEFMPHVFERFRQADMGETRQHSGLGIGLALSRHLVELQGGTIEAHSPGVGQGALFVVRLPWVEGGGASRSVSLNGAAKAPASKPSLAGVTVLLVEDDASTREAMERTLAHAGASVVPVPSSDQALGVLDAPREAGPAPDVMICDIGLPGMSGHELLETIVQRCRARGQRPLPACAVSAHARDIDRQRALAAGFDLYLIKPVGPDQLIEAVEDLRDVAASPRSEEA
jgi:PAS domain S-box-containing protein